MSSFSPGTHRGHHTIPAPRRSTRSPSPGQYPECVTAAPPATPNARPEELFQSTVHPKLPAQSTTTTANAAPHHRTQSRRETLIPKAYLPQDGGAEEGGQPLPCIRAAPAPIRNSRANLVVNPVAGHTLALLGWKSLIVVHTEDATLVMPRDRAEELKELHGRVEEGLK